MFLSLYLCFLQWPLGENMSSSASATTAPGRRGYRTSGTFNLPHLTAGLLQCARGVNFSSLTNGFGAGLTNCAPILDAQASLVNLHAPLHVDFDLQLTEAAVRLAISLFTCVRSGEPKRESDSEHEGLKKRWCAVVYNLLQSLTSESPSFTEPVSTTSAASPPSKVGSSVPIIGRLVGLMRSVSFSCAVLFILSLFFSSSYHLELKNSMGTLFFPL